MKWNCCGCLKEVDVHPVEIGWESGYVGDGPKPDDEWLCERCNDLLTNNPDALVPVDIFAENIVQKAASTGVSMWDLVK